MTTELEKQFFDTFGIEKIKMCRYHHCKCTFKDGKGRVSTMCPGEYASKKPCYFVIEEYPQIKDKHYLKLICLFTKEMNCYTCYTSDLEMLKENILKEFILEKGSFTKEQVQEIFEEKR